MRTSLLPGLVEALRRNRARQQTRVRLFELGRTFHAAGEGRAPDEVRRIAAVACGPALAEGWDAGKRGVDFYDLKGDVEALLGLSAAAALGYRPAPQPWLHPGRSAEVLRDGVAIGVVGHLHPGIAAALDLDTEVVVFELEADAVQRRGVARAAELSRFPAVRRDLAVVVPESTPWAALEASVRAALGPLLREVLVFDRYLGPGLDSGTKSLAMGLILQEVSRTLTDSDADAAMQAALVALQRDCGAQRR
jgi:phenylalanyl-tRNA synthetase beta chain